MTCKKIRSLITLAAAAAVMSVPAAAAEPMPHDRLQALARSASTPAEHAEVAKQYRLHAEAQEAIAAQHEARVAQLTRSSGAIIHKWPGMASAQLQAARRDAVQARRAARESWELADRHLRLAVEAQAVGD